MIKGDDWKMKVYCPCGHVDVWFTEITLIPACPACGRSTSRRIEGGPWIEEEPTNTTTTKE